MDVINQIQRAQQPPDKQHTPMHPDATLHHTLQPQPHHKVELPEDKGLPHTALVWYHRRSIYVMAVFVNSAS